MCEIDGGPVFAAEVELGPEMEAPQQIAAKMDF